MRDAPLVFLIAGEPSGDALGARLMAACRRAAGGRVRFAGVGGERMANEGLVSLFPLDDIAVMGLAEVIPRLAVLRRRLIETVAGIVAARPDVVVTIDAPSFCFRVADRIRPLGVPIVHYVAPQIWAWRPGRVKRLRRRIDHLMALLPFELEFFANSGVPCTYVGHPAIEGAPTVSREAARRRLGLDPAGRVLVVLPGSRAGLAARMAPIFGETVRLVASARPDLSIVIPTVSATAAMVVAAAAGWGAPWREVRGAEDKQAAFAAADAALTVSGTSTLELAVARLPMVVAYRTSAITAFLARRLIRVPHVAMPNLIAGHDVVPECLQEQCEPSTLSREVARLLDDAGAAAAQRAALASVSARLEPGGARPSDRAAAVVLAAARGSAMVP